MKERFVIVKKYDKDGIRYNDRMYYRDELTGFISGINGCAQFFTYDAAGQALDDINDKGIFQIEKIFIKA